MKNVVVDNAAAAARHIPASAHTPCAEAFIDLRNPNSDGKLNYSFIGPGVTQSDTQVVNLQEPHGFNVGGVSLPAGRVNNLHLHFTAEVFICAAGAWEFVWGNEGENTARFGPRDVITIPTWIFRGFVNRSAAEEDAFMFSVLGGDDTGGIIWNPRVLDEAARAGMRLSARQRVIDEQAGETLPEGEEYITPMPAAEMAKLPVFQPQEMERFIVRWDSLKWRDDALAGGGALACVLGHGMTAARHHAPQVAHPHGFSVEWLRLRAGESTGAWQTAARQVAIVFEGAPRAVLNGGGDAVEVALEARSLFSFPPNARRQIVNSGESDALVLMVHGGDGRVLPQWDEAALSQMDAAGWTLDADGYFAPKAALAAA